MIGLYFNNMISILPKTYTAFGFQFLASYNKTYTKTIGYGLYTAAPSLTIPIGPDTTKVAIEWKVTDFQLITVGLYDQTGVILLISISIYLQWNIQPFLFIDFSRLFASYGPITLKVLGGTGSVKASWYSD